MSHVGYVDLNGNIIKNPNVDLVPGQLVYVGPPPLRTSQPTTPRPRGELGAMVDALLTADRSQVSELL